MRKISEELPPVKVKIKLAHEAITDCGKYFAWVSYGWMLPSGAFSFRMHLGINKENAFATHWDYIKDVTQQDGNNE